jgi:hypothetical protein
VTRCIVASYIAARSGEKYGHGLTVYGFHASPSAYENGETKPGSQAPPS